MDLYGWLRKLNSFNFSTFLNCFVLIILTNTKTVVSIGCFVCSSINGSNPQCEDTFNAHPGLYRAECFGGREGRTGLFPADSCIKVKAEKGAYTVLVRACSVDNGETTSDGEIGRESHCWMVNMVNYDDVLMKGCSLACKTDGCNTGTYLKYSTGSTLFAAMILFVGSDVINSAGSLLTAILLFVVSTIG